MHRHSFWNEIYETVLAPYILMPTLMAMINPKLGSFNVTAKGGVVNRSVSSIGQDCASVRFSARLSICVGLVMAIPRLLLCSGVAVEYCV